MSRNDLGNKNWPANSFRHSVAKEMIHQKIFQTITCKYHKSCKNKQFKKILDVERKKAKKGPENLVKLKAQKK